MLDQEAPLIIIRRLLSRTPASPLRARLGAQCPPLNERNDRERQRKCGDQAEHDGEHSDGDLSASKRVRV
jgi:hypothetical protein